MTIIWIPGKRFTGSSLVGKRSPDDVVAILQKGTIYLQPSIQEGFCNSVLEAQAAGLLCVVSDAVGLPENVVHESTGWVVPKRNAAKMADKIIEILQIDESGKLQIRQNAIERVKDMFGGARHIEAWRAFFS